MGRDVGHAQAQALMLCRLALGTVQFGLPYGIANRTGQVPVSDVAVTLAAARRAGMDTLDTAIGYGQSEAVLGALDVGDWKVVTKLPGRPEDASATWVADEVAKSLDRLRLERVHAVMLHRTSDLLGPDGPELYHALQELRESGVADLIGYSIYDPAELDALFTAYPADTVQAPLNAFDQRLASTGWLDRLAAKGVEVHTRSAFLQGLLLLAPADRPAKFARWERELGAWDRYCNSTGGDRLLAALSYVLWDERIDRVVVGVDSSAQLRQILNAAAGSRPPQSVDLTTGDELLLNPSRWNSI